MSEFDREGDFVGSHHVVRFEDTGHFLADLDLERRVADPERRTNSLAARAVNLSPGWPSGSTRWQVSAVSVVDIGQMWRSWIPLTPVRLSR